MYNYNTNSEIMFFTNAIKYKIYYYDIVFCLQMVLCPGTTLQGLMEQTSRTSTEKAVQIYGQVWLIMY